MSERDPVMLLLKDLHAPAAPTREFTDALWAKLLAELPEQYGAGIRQPVPRGRLTPLLRGRRPLLAGGIALALVAAAMAAVLLSKPSGASAFEVVQQARRDFTRLPAFQATIVVKNPGLRIVYRRFYRDPGAWRSEVSSAVDPTGSAHAGDFEVWNGRLLGAYRVDDPHHFYVTPANEARATNHDRAATEDLDPHFYNWPGPRANTRLPADQYFKRSCKVLPNELVAGREARHLACHYGGATIGIWLDSRYGLLLRLVGPGRGVRFEVRSIAINPSFPRGVFKVTPPPGSTETWAGSGRIPKSLRQRPSGRVSATIPVGSHPGRLAVGAGSVWVANIADGSVTRIDPASNRVIATIAGLHAYGLTFADGAPWVATNAGLVERIDPATNRPVGRPVSVGGGSTSYRDLAYGNGTLWVVGGKRRTVRLAGGAIDPNYASIVRVDPASGRVVADIAVQADLADVAVIAVGQGSAWVASYRYTSSRSSALVLFRIDPRRNRVVGMLDLGRYGIARVVPGAGSVWLTAGNENQRGYLVRVDPRSSRVVARVRVGESPDGIAISPGSIWVANFQDGTVSEVDPATNRVVGAPVPIGDGPADALDAFRALWVANNQDNAVVRVAEPDVP